MTPRSWRDARGSTTLKADVVIVGSGPGGAAMARTLAEGGAKVVLLEEGPATPMFRPNSPHTMRYHMQEGGQMIAQGPAWFPVAAGRGVGGGSLINSAICWRTPDEVLAGWVERLDDDRFSSAAMAPIYEEHEDLLGIAETPEDIAGENNKLIVRGARALGLPGGYLRRNTPDCVGCGICNYGCPSGGKASVDRNLIPMAMRAGAVVQADVKVESVRVEGGRAVGVTGMVRDTETGAEVGELRVDADKVVICGGGIGTPRLLHHTGLASDLGPHLGAHLHLHPGNGVFGLCDFPVRLWTGATQGAWFKDPEIPSILPHTLNLPPGALLLAMGGIGLEVKEHMAMVDRMCGCLVMVSDHGEGTVGATWDGRASIAYQWADEDIQACLKGMIRSAEVLVAGGAKRLLVPVRGVGWIDSVDEMRAKLQGKGLHDFLALYSSHPTGSCRLGRSRDEGVIGPSGEAWGLPGLYVADGSIFPTPLGVNPQLTIMVMSTIIARGMLA